MLALPHHQHDFPASCDIFGLVLPFDCCLQFERSCCKHLYRRKLFLGIALRQTYKWLYRRWNWFQLKVLNRGMCERIALSCKPVLILRTESCDRGESKSPWETSITGQREGQLSLSAFDNRWSTVRNRSYSESDVSPKDAGQLTTRVV